ncbi:hypothetical protein SteCoe_20707 [Stentor coeruleus]|uniref:UDP-N-acetylglucosamine--dolichyl-phosphate N-acetylglucosaminephosphotransferase n=1 Tax=Stentor coeruleus TaxID=5963 RepID=A0A1R2BRC1_9CILI|nr:hypothetical protein SteCoe_20707 [Stentor coeruleus]
MDFFSLIISSCACFPFVFSSYIGFNEWESLIPLMITSFFSFIITLRLIPIIKKTTRAAGLYGKDLNKNNPKEIPEALGIVPATAYLVTLILTQLFYASDKNSQVQYNSAAFSVCFMIFLGFADDVLNLRWRYKLLLPTIASFPLIVAYSGTTLIIVPEPLRIYLGKAIELGILYKIYMMMLAVFCTNAINIYAGVNGIEAGQSLVIASAALTHNFIEIFLHISDDIYKQHLISVSLLLPFLMSTLALLKYNKYPSKVFVGDTYCYFAGMTFAMAGILGHYSKTMLLFFIPQILNFLISVPQIFGFFECPRHRLPHYNAKEDILEPVTKHHTLINLILWIIGPTHERELVNILIILQIVSCGLAFYIRYHVSSLFY